MSHIDPRSFTEQLEQTDITETSAGADVLMGAVYDELRELARRFFRNERANHTLQPTALVHEAYLRLVDQTHATYRGRAHFFAIAARAMRRVLVDYARQRGRAKRGGQAERLALSVEAFAEVSDALDTLAVHEALEELEQLDEREARVVELRFFGGLNIDEIADLLHVSKRTIEGDWTHAKAWLRARLANDAK